MPFDGAFSTAHIVVVAVVALLVLGPEQLPKAARALGEGLGVLRRLRAQVHRELRDVVAEFDHGPPTSAGGSSTADRETRGR